jgi:mono/diheme cytochrome c family protein
MIARCLAAVAGLVLVPAAHADPGEDARLAVRARAILMKHCAACHGGKDSRSTLQVLNHTQMVRVRHAQFVTPQQPDLSLAIELIEQGSMPPGRYDKLSKEEIKDLRAWIATGAAAYPAKFDDEFAYQAILADVRKIKGNAELQDSRYLSIHHLADTSSPAELSIRRANFLRDLDEVRIPGAPPPKAVDSTHTIFRIRLKESGWQHEAFRKILEDGTDEELKNTNLFDLVLLEYPHAIIPTESKSFDELAVRFLQPAQQVRPIPFVRGDWFVAVTTSRPLTTDLHYLMAEFEHNPPKAFRKKPIDLPVRTTEPMPLYTGPGYRLPALDAWFEPDPPDGRPAVRGLSVKTMPARGKGDSPIHTFRPGETFRLRISADENDGMVYQFIWINSKRRVDTPSDVMAYQSGMPSPHFYGLPRVRDKKQIVLDDVKEAEKEEIRIFAAAGQTQFPVGVKWRTGLRLHVVERFVHPFFPLKKVGDQVTVDLSDARITRKTAHIEIVPKK